MIKFRQFTPVGVYLKDIQEYTGYSNMKLACEKAGVTRWKLKGRQYAPLSVSDVYKLLAVIRQLQGHRYNSHLEKSLADSVNPVKIK